MCMLSYAVYKNDAKEIFIVYKKGDKKQRLFTTNMLPLIDIFKDNTVDLITRKFSEEEAAEIAYKVLDELLLITNPPGVYFMGDDKDYPLTLIDTRVSGFKSNIEYYSMIEALIALSCKAVIGGLADFGFDISYCVKEVYNLRWKDMMNALYLLYTKEISIDYFLKKYLNPDISL